MASESVELALWKREQRIEVIMAGLDSTFIFCMSDMRTGIRDADIKNMRSTMTHKDLFLFGVRLKDIRESLPFPQRSWRCDKDYSMNASGLGRWLKTLGSEDEAFNWELWNFGCDS